MGHGTFFVFLTLLTQIGGLAYLVALILRREWWGRALAFVLIYVGLSTATLFVAPLFGRQHLPCVFSFDEAPLYARTPIYCALNRNYVRAELKQLSDELSIDLTRRGDATSAQALDGGFPFLDWFPMLPHLSHRGGRSLDIALPYLNAEGEPTRATPSSLGYFVFEQPRAGDRQPCRGYEAGWKTLRFDFPWLQPKEIRQDLDWAKLRKIVRHFAESPHVSRILLEPHLVDRLGYIHPKIRFAGCRAARHDDHIHIQMRRG